MNNVIKISNNRLNIDLLNLHIKIIKEKLKQLLIYNKLANNIKYIIRPTCNSKRNLELLRFKLCKLSYNINNKTLKVIYTSESLKVLQVWVVFIENILNKYNFNYKRNNNVFIVTCQFNNLLFFISLLEQYELSRRI